MKRLMALLLALSLGLARAGVLDGAQCIAPAKPGGGFDLTCQLLREALRDLAPARPALRIAYLPGGIGAVAFNSAVTERRADAHALVAFSSGSLLNLAQGRFGPYTERDVRWLAALGMDHGVIAVRRESPFRSLGQLLAAWREQPQRVAFGAGGSIGSQDWMKAALLARAAGVSHKAMRFVAFEGGGEALAALQGDHVQVVAGDAAEVGRQIEQGAPIRVLAVLAEARLPGRWASVPTAREQGYDIRWPILRGVYLGAGVGEREQREWLGLLHRAMARPAFARELARAGLQPAFMTGPALEARIGESMAQYRALAAEFGLRR